MLYKRTNRIFIKSHVTFNLKLNVIFDKISILTFSLTIVTFQTFDVFRDEGSK